MEPSDFTFGDFCPPFMRSVFHRVIFPHVTNLSLFIMFPCLQKLRGHFICVIIITSILCMSHAQTHNNNDDDDDDRYRYHSSTSPRNMFTSSNNDQSLIYIVTFRNYYSPVPNNLKNISNLKHDALSKIVLTKNLSKRKQASHPVNKNPSYDSSTFAGKILNTSVGLNPHHEVNISSIPEMSAIIKNDVLIDSYRSSSLCLGYYQTHWIRDARNCSMFFVCSRNRVDAVLTCPKRFVWSNRVTNCVPMNSRWDDCVVKNKNKETIASGYSPRKRFRTILRKPSILRTRNQNSFEEKLVSSTSAQTTFPPPTTPAKKLQNQHRLQQSLMLRRQRLGYRSNIRLKNKLLKRRKSTGHGYVIHLLKETKPTHNHVDNGNNGNTLSDPGVNRSKRNRKRIEHRFKYKTRPRHQDEIQTTDMPAATQITTTPTIKKSFTSDRRKWLKYRRITHSFLRTKLKHSNKNSISKSRDDHRYHSKYEQSKISNGNGDAFESTSDNTHRDITTESPVTNWWDIPNDLIEDLKVTTQVPHYTTKTTTMIFENTTQSRSDISSTQSHVFVPECGVSASPLIVGGLPVKRDKWPWVVSLQLTWLSRHMCGATLVHPRWLVTAAHCMAEPDLSHPEDWRVIFENVKSRTKIDYIIKHPSFVNGDNYPNDIAMLRLKHPADVTGFHIRHACLPPQKWNRSHWDKCWIMGWGEAKEGTVAELKELEVNIWKNSECSARWGWKRILNSHMCVGTGDSGACNGDSGGPLICRRNGYHYLTGITSWGVYGCQTTGYPGVFVNVASYREWIDDIIQTRTT